MRLTPEGTVKSKLAKILNALEPRPYTFFPATGGYGRNGVPDVVGCWRGRFFAIECKAPGKIGTTTALQHREIQKINEAGGTAFIYDGTMDEEEIIARLLQPCREEIMILNLSAKMEAERASAIAVLGDRWLLHPKNSPTRGGAAIDTLREDAKRYLWLRDGGDETYPPLTKQWHMSSEMIDDCIDNAISRTKEK